MGYIGYFHFEMEDWELAVVARCFPPVVEEQIQAVISGPGQGWWSLRAGAKPTLYIPPAQPVSAPPFPAPLMSPAGTGCAAQESKQDRFLTLFHPMSC